MISSDISTTDAATLHTQHDSKRAFAEGTLDLPCDMELPQDTEASGSVTSSPDNGCAESGLESLLSASEGKKRGEHEDTDTGVYLESGSSGCCTLSTDIRDMVLEELEPVFPDTAAYDVDNNGQQCSITSGGPSNCCDTTSQSASSLSEQKGLDSEVVSETKHCIGDSKKPASLSQSVHCSERQPESTQAEMSTCSLGGQKSTDRSFATEENSACGGDDTSFDSSPEPHAPSYGDVFNTGLLLSLSNVSYMYIKHLCSYTLICCSLKLITLAIIASSLWYYYK